MPVVDELLAANQRFAQRFTQGDLPTLPARQLAVLTCMDARLHPETFLGLAIGDAHVIRNAGGRASDDALRSLIISSRLLGTRAVVVIHHTDCGMLTFTNEEIRDQIRQNLGADASHVDFLPLTDLETSVRSDMEAIRSSPLLPPDITVRGFVYDVQSGRLREIV